VSIKSGLDQNAVSKIEQLIEAVKTLTSRKYVPQAEDELSQEIAIADPEDIEKSIKISNDCKH